MSCVAITRCTSYDRDEVFEAVKKACLACRFPDVRDKKILVKPNILSDAKPEDCITTHPEVLRAVIKLLKEMGCAQIYCADSPGIQNPGFSGKNCQLGQVCADEGATWVDFTVKPDVYQINGTKQHLPLAHILKEVDLVFSVCKFKTHQLMYTTGAVKNLFGLVPSLNKSACHVKNPTRESFARLIVGIHETVKPAFCITDAVLGMEGPGPANGTPRGVNLIMASESLFAADYAQQTIMGYGDDDIPITNEARRRKIFPSEITYPLLNANDLVIEDYRRIQVQKKQYFFSRLLFPYFTRRIQKALKKKDPAPSFDTDKCIVCKRCINICPAKALSLDENRHVTINKKECIRCYCCHEMCPADAIEIRQ